MSSAAKAAWKYGLFAIAILLMVLAWMVYFHNERVLAWTPRWMEKTVMSLGEKKTAAVEEDEDPDTSLNEIPVHTAKISTRTMNRYVEGIGTVTPRPQRKGQPAGSANIASPAAGVVEKVLCQVGQNVKANDVLIQLDDRLAKAAEEQAQAALDQANASLAALKAMPRPEQLAMAKLAMGKAQAALEFAQKNYERQKSLLADEGTSSKTVEQAAADLAAAKSEVSSSASQLALVQAGATAEETAQETAKVAQAAAALAAARTQRQMLTIVAPMDATVVAVTVNPREGVDAAKTLVSLVAMDKLIVDVDVPADQLPENAEGLTALVTPAGLKGSKAAVKTVTGKVAFVTPEVETKTGAIMVGIELPAESGLRPGLTVQVRIVAETHKDALVAPREAVVANENGDSVIAIVEKDKEGHDQATHSAVTAGIEEEGMIEISGDDVKDGATVVTQGAFGLPQAGRVKVLD